MSAKVLLLLMAIVASINAKPNMRTSDEDTDSELRQRIEDIVLKNIMDSSDEVQRVANELDEIIDSNEGEYDDALPKIDEEKEVEDDEDEDYVYNRNEEANKGNDYEQKDDDDDDVDEEEDTVEVEKNEAVDIGMGVQPGYGGIGTGVRPAATVEVDGEEDDDEEAEKKPFFIPVRVRRPFISPLLRWRNFGVGPREPTLVRGGLFGLRPVVRPPPPPPIDESEFERVLRRIVEQNEALIQQQAKDPLDDLTISLEETEEADKDDDDDDDDDSSVEMEEIRRPEEVLLREEAAFEPQPPVEEPGRIRIIFRSVPQPDDDDDDDEAVEEWRHYDAQRRNSGRVAYGASIVVSVVVLALLVMAYSRLIVVRMRYNRQRQQLAEKARTAVFEPVKGNRALLIQQAPGGGYANDIDV